MDGKRLKDVPLLGVGSAYVIISSATASEKK